MFKQKFHKLQDENIKNTILDWSILIWYNLRTAFASVIIIGPVVSIPVFRNFSQELLTSIQLLVTSYDDVSAGLAALLIIYVIRINEDITYFFVSLSYFELQLISLERCKKFAG